MLSAHKLRRINLQVPFFLQDAFVAILELKALITAMQKYGGGIHDR